MKKLFAAIALLVLVAAARPALADSLWLGNDNSGDVFQTTTNGAVITDLPLLAVTGIAFDGANLYFADRGGNFTKRTADGSTVLDSFTVSSGGIGEDLAWDFERDVLWRIVHNNVLQEIDPATHSLVASFNIPTTDPILGRLGGLGIAYDGTRDELYVSFCSSGCSPLAAGLVDIVDPDTGLVLGELFRTEGFYTGGLGFDPATDSLWVGDQATVRNMSLGGAPLSSFTRPQPGGFVDGLEFVSTVPEPTSLLLLGTGLLGVAGVVRRKWLG